MHRDYEKFERAKRKIMRTHIGDDIVSSEIAEEFDLPKVMVSNYLLEKVESDDLKVRYVLSCPKCQAFISSLLSSEVNKDYPFMGILKCATCGYAIDQIEGYGCVDLVFRTTYSEEAYKREIMNEWV